MKYTITASTEDCSEITQVFDVRSDASLKTILMKGLKALTEILEKSLHAQIEWPNIWRNGGVGYVCCKDDDGNYYTITLYRNDNGILIFG